MNKIILLLSAISLTLFSSCCGCRGAKSKSLYSLYSNSWKLVEMNSEKISSEQESYKLTFNETDKTVTGMGDCNRIFSEFETIGVNGLTIKGGGSTRMFCPNQQTEDAFLRELSSVDSYSIDADVLLLIKNGEVSLIFYAEE